ncbi:MAG: hypothetical protein AAGC55_03910 [Myxococcota bacterium]
MLNREVLPPYKPSSGFGVIVVAALIMFTAIASSALVVNTRISDNHCPTRQARQVAGSAAVGAPAADNWHQSPAQWQAAAEPKAEGVAPCGTPQYRHHADGSFSVSFTVCPEEAQSAWGIRSAEPPEVVIPASPAPAVIEVGDVIR